MFILAEKVWTDSQIFGILWPAEEFEGCHAVAEASDVFAMRDEYEVKLVECLAKIDRLTTAGMNTAYGEAIKADEANDYYAELERLQARYNELLEWARKAYVALGDLGYLTAWDALNVVELRREAPENVERRTGNVERVSKPEVDDDEDRYMSRE